MLVTHNIRKRLYNFKFKMVPKFQAAVVAGFVVAVASFAAAKPAIYSNAFGGENSNVNITVRDPDSYRFEMRNITILDHFTGDP